MKRLSMGILALNAIAIVMYSPNYLSLFIPWIKLFPLVALALNIVYISASKFSYHDLIRQSLLLVFGGMLFLTSFISYQRFQVVESVNFAFSFNLKIFQLVSCYLIISSKEHFIFFIKVIMVLLALISLHALLQFSLFSLDLIHPHLIVETQGYIYHYMGLWGFYRVSAEFGGISILRAQSFFQEPGFLAFYFCVGLFLLRYIRTHVGMKVYFMLALTLISGVLVTLSFTGLILLMFYFLTIRGMRVFKLSSVFVGICIAGFILLNPNEYMSKGGSLMLRINDLSNIAELIISEMYFITGMGFGTEFLFTESRVNNFVFEAFLYSSFIGFIIISLYYFQIFKNSNLSSMMPANAALFFSLSTPMFWSPLVILCFVLVDKYDRYLSEDI